MQHNQTNMMTATVLFEGSEKKFEAAIDPASPSLRGVERARWEKVVQASRATILSVLSNEHCDAYLLSESSLFVFDHKVIMITCGRTDLVGGVMSFLEIVPPERIELFIYQRKNELFPREQPTSFFEDASRLHQVLPGKAFQFGGEDEHHMHLFHLDRPYTAQPDDKTLEILMYGLGDKARHLFCDYTHTNVIEVHRASGVCGLLPGFKIDDYLFNPAGYSLNAIKDDEYYTIHVTPQHRGAYISFETNHRLADDLDALVKRVLAVFEPSSFDLVLFDQPHHARIEENGYRRKTIVVQPDVCGYQVQFMNYYRPQVHAVEATSLPLA